MADSASGVLKLTKNRSGVLRNPARSFRPTPQDPFVPNKLIQQFGLAEGATVVGPVQRGKKGLQLTGVDSVCGLSPEEFRSRRPYTELTAINPDKRFQLAACGNRSMRVVDLVAPIGKGTRGLIVSPPKAGKTILLQQIANAIRAEDADARIIVLLIDERPEEVTDFRRAAAGVEILASTLDDSGQAHVELAELTLAHVRAELECGRDVVVLVDSLTRMGRAFNVDGPNRGRGRTLSGGMEDGAMEIPRRFFGMARKIENGGSVTIIATALIDTGSRMDTLIFEEFKGTGNSEIVLDRSLAEERIFPAIDIPASGTRKEDRLYDEDGIRRLAQIRRALADCSPKEAMDSLLKLVDKHPTNEDLLQSIPIRV
ncbi:MAG: transcription termination factor Rho [Candidatus Eisenbacteria bacterium]|nr:transcription termination factor Rho [Candidatus Eisenbacteria bacterium]